MSFTYDECNGSSTQVNEMWCYESPAGSGNFVPGRTVYDCPYGCLDGACGGSAPTLWLTKAPTSTLTAATVDQACEPNDLVNARDYSIVIVNYGKKGGKGDVNGDYVVNGLDLSLVLKYLGKQVVETTKTPTP